MFLSVTATRSDNIMLCVLCEYVRNWLILALTLCHSTLYGLKVSLDKFRLNGKPLMERRAVPEKCFLTSLYALHTKTEMLGGILLSMLSFNKSGTVV